MSGLRHFTCGLLLTCSCVGDCFRFLAMFLFWCVLCVCVWLSQCTEGHVCKWTTFLEHTGTYEERCFHETADTLRDSSQVSACFPLSVYMYMYMCLAALAFFIDFLCLFCICCCWIFQFQFTLLIELEHRGKNSCTEKSPLSTKTVILHKTVLTWQEYTI